METEKLLMLAQRLGYIDDRCSQPAFKLVTEITKMLTALRKRLIK